MEGPTVATMNLRLVSVLARPFYQLNEFKFWLYLRLQKCCIQAVKGTGLSGGFDCGVQQRAYTMWHPHNPKWIVKFHWRNPQLHCLTCHCGAEIVEPKGLSRARWINLRYSFCCLYIHIVENLFRNFLRIVHCSVINIGVSNCQLKLYCLWDFSGKKLPWDD